MVAAATLAKQAIADEVGFKPPVAHEGQLFKKVPLHLMDPSLPANDEACATVIIATGSKNMWTLLDNSHDGIARIWPHIEGRPLEDGSRRKILQRSGNNEFCLPKISSGIRVKLRTMQLPISGIDRNGITAFGLRALLGLAPIAKKGKKGKKQSRRRV